MEKKHIDGDGDWEVCLCFGVSERKIRKFCRLQDPQMASQLSECYGAGTGCGSCIPDLERIFNEENARRRIQQSDG